MLHRAAELTQQGLVLTLVLSMPALGAAALVGLAMGLFSSTTQINDQALTYLPKLLGVALVLVLFGGWGAALMLRFTRELWLAIPTLVR